MGRAVKRLHEWADNSETGDRDELVPGVPDATWRQVSVTARECLGAARCPVGDDCFAEKARADGREGRHRGHQPRAAGHRRDGRPRRCCPSTTWWWSTRRTSWWTGSPGWPPPSSPPAWSAPRPGGWASWWTRPWPTGWPRPARAWPWCWRTPRPAAGTCCRRPRPGCCPRSGTPPGPAGPRWAASVVRTRRARPAARSPRPRWTTWPTPRCGCSARSTSRTRPSGGTSCGWPSKARTGPGTGCCGPRRCGSAGCCGSGCSGARR